MNFMSSILSNNVVKFVAHYALAGIVRASGVCPKQAQAKPRNTQCVKLTQEHERMTRLVTYWCNLRINKLQQQGVSDKEISAMIKHDARFLSSLAHAIACQAEDEPLFDAWLFFNEDVEETDFFELQHCARGSKVAKATFVIQADR